MTRCNYCGAMKRTNYPHGRKSKSITTVSHRRNCPYNEKNKRRR